MALSNADIFQRLKQQELELSDPTIRKNAGRLAELIADDFEEVGKSGRRFSKQDIIRDLQQEQAIEFSAHSFAFVSLGDDCVLVKYQTTMNNQTANRCSIWVKRNDRWVVLYHQGTLVD